MSSNSVAETISSLPPVFWSAVVAAVITAAFALIGIVASNASNTKRLRIQLAHDSREKSRERISQMRRSVYLHAASEMSHALAHLGNLPQLDTRKDNLTEPLIKFNSAASQVQLIAESNTAALFAEMGKNLTSVYFRMIKKVQPIFDLRIDYEMHESMRNFAQREFDQLIAEARSLSKSPNADISRLSLLTDSINTYKQKIQTHGESMVECMNKRTELHKKYASELMEETRPIVESQLPLLVEIRKELELTSDKDELVARAETSFIEFKRMLDDALDELP